MVGRAHAHTHTRTQMLAHREEHLRPSPLVAQGYFVFFTSPPPPPVYSARLSIQLWTEWSGKWEGYEEGIRNYILCEVACLEVRQGDVDFQLMLGIMSKSHLTPLQVDHVSGMSISEWKVIGVGDGSMAYIDHTLPNRPLFLEYTGLHNCVPLLNFTFPFTWRTTFQSLFLVV
jgi:hypothetical protein